MNESDRSFRLFSGIAKASSDAVILLDAEGAISFWNDSAQNLFGYAENEILGKPFMILLAPRQHKKRERLDFGRAHRIHEGPVVAGITLELLAITRYGKEFPIELSHSSVELEEGWNDILILHDITERKAAKEQMMLFSEIVESSYDAIINIDKEGNIQSWNTGARKIYGFSPEEIIGENISILIPPDRKKEETTMILENIAKHTRLKNHQTIRVTKSGDKKYIALSLSPLINEEGEVTGASVIGRDITKEKKMAKTMLSYITVAALRLKNPVEIVRDNLICLLDLVDVLDPTDADIDEIMLQLEIQIKNSEQIIHNLRELNQAIIGSFEEEVPDSYRTFFQEK